MLFALTLYVTHLQTLLWNAFQEHFRNEHWQTTFTIREKGERTLHELWHGHFRNEHWQTLWTLRERERTLHKLWNRHFRNEHWQTLWTLRERERTLHELWHWHLRNEHWLTLWNTRERERILHELWHRHLRNEYWSTLWTLEKGNGHYTNYDTDTLGMNTDWHFETHCSCKGNWTYPLNLALTFNTISREQITMSFCHW